MYTIARKNNHIPHRPMNIPFDIWFDHYKHNLIDLFAIFKEQLHDVHPFCENQNLDMEKTFKKFSNLIYKNSSGVIK